ncbi:MAG TPA: ice-binding family protein [Cytophagaceae bacterium]|jgi:hypothetical protein
MLSKFSLILPLILGFNNFLSAQAPQLGSAADFVLFSSIGAVTHSGSAPSQLTGDIGGNANASTGFGNVNGRMQDKNGVSAKASQDLLLAYQQMKNTPKTSSVAPLLGNGQVLEKGVYEIGGAATLNQGLTLDAKNDANAVFIFKVLGALSTNASAKVHLKNGALACNVFWMIEGQVGMAAGTTMRGSVIVNNAAIVMSVGDTLEGRVLTTNGAITVSGILGYTPLGCRRAVLNGPIAPSLGTSACFALFSSTGDVANTGVTNVKGDVGSNTGAATGFNASLVKGTIHASPNNTTQQAATDLLKAYTYSNTVPNDIELLYPNLFGNNLVLTPHTYYMNAAAKLTDTVTLDAQNNPNAVFLIKINGAFSTTVNSKVKLVNGAQAKNVYWAVKGAATIAGNSTFAGTVMNEGAVGSLGSGVKLDGRALTVAGALNTSAMHATAQTDGCLVTYANEMSDLSSTMTVSPNPFAVSVTFEIPSASESNSSQLSVYDIFGVEIINKIISSPATVLSRDELNTGIFYFKVVNKAGLVQTGKLISQ